MNNDVTNNNEHDWNKWFFFQGINNSAYCLIGDLLDKNITIVRLLFCQGNTLTSQNSVQARGIIYIFLIDTCMYTNPLLAAEL